MLKFTPPKGSARYAYAQGSLFNTYGDIGHAKNAYHAHGMWADGQCFILERVEDSWYILYTIEGRTQYPNLPWVSKASGYYANPDPRARPMTRDEYAEWRLAVERERNMSPSVVHGRPIPGSGIEADENDARRLQAEWLASKSAE